ncbi:MAG: hypothetical protein LBR36_02015 [Bacteroidales bacterium]|jgi:hypothetical protein|nr:hypothetical protein [Bacteroidales bacterium]
MNRVVVIDKQMYTCEIAFKCALKRSYLHAVAFIVKQLPPPPFVKTVKNTQFAAFFRLKIIAVYNGVMERIPYAKDKKRESLKIHKSRVNFLKNNAL